MNSATKLIVVGHGSKMGLKMEPAIAALLSHGTVGAAAKAVGLGENTLLRWMKDPKFEKALSAARDQMFVHAMGRLQGAATDAADTVTSIMNNPKSPIGFRLKAAELILQHARKMVRGAEDNIKKARSVLKG
jgi:hypothetical protein